jgi:hypothetical protein
MSSRKARRLLQELELGRVAPAGEVAVDVEVAGTSEAHDPQPVLLLTDEAIYAAGSSGWRRLPLSRVGAVQVGTDVTGMLTRYCVADDSGAPWLDRAVPMAHASFRARMQELAARLQGERARPSLVVLPSPVELAGVASTASRASAASLVSVSSLASALRARPAREVRIA